jgi:hypothetical protein
MKWYYKTAILLGCGFLLGAETINLIRILLVETTGIRILPHAGVWFFMLVLIIPLAIKSKEWFS